MRVSRFDRFLGYIAPHWALRRHSARIMLNVLGEKRSFEAIDSNRLRGDWTNITKDADAANINSLETLRNRVRDIERNSGIISGPIKRIANNVVGRGIVPQSKVKEDGPYDTNDPKRKIPADQAEKFNYQAEKNWRIWISKADAQLRQTFYEQQKLAFTSMLRDGEILSVCRSSKNYGRIIPLCNELIEIDRLSTPASELKNTKIRNGIEFDTEGVPIRYYILKKHPGSSTFVALAKETDFEVIDAFDTNGTRKVSHLYDILRPGQSRGYSPFISGLSDIQDLSRYLEAEIVAARVAACLAAFVETPGAYGMHNALDSNASSQRISEFEPGMIEYLAPGEKINTFMPNRPSTQFADFIRQMLRNISNAVDTPYELFSGDWAGMNYSNARTVLLQAYLGFRIYQSYMINHFCAPIWENFVQDCVIADLVDAPLFAVRRYDYLRCSWVAPGWQWVDPLKESKSAQTELEASINTLSDILAGKGQDWEETLEQRAEELKKIKELEEKYDIKFSIPKGGNGNGGFEESEKEILISKGE